ncbi:GNAT family N-acetyltransferase [Nonomuraea africana]|uniref:GNAT family acetyltransferase n=1 Tax=Nonomuraea africana TaxID=46171 RepID=A0ABR9K7Q5_9ACTN|nr:GNAT family N-acetyltransferase [Nonomuraea africana]MBE1557803.1 putative GNAT family acetyltransferase [Nonomuraea africana]
MWTFSSDFAEYAKHAEAFLCQRPAANTVALTLLASLRSGMPCADDSYFGWWTENGQVCGAVFRTPPRPLYLADVPPSALVPLAEALRERGTDVPVVSGPVELGEAFLTAWGATSSERRPERLYRLGTLAVPEVPGAGRRADLSDFPLVMSWFQAFADEVGMNGGGDLAELTQRRISHGDVQLWVDGDAPVSVAGVSAEAAGMCRIGPVYTPPSCRRRGYGAAVTAYASQVALTERCQEVVLFTDLNNPTSNAIYQSIGYEPVSDYAHIALEPVP